MLSVRSAYHVAGHKEQAQRLQLVQCVQCAFAVTPVIQRKQLCSVYVSAASAAFAYKKSNSSDAALQLEHCCRAIAAACRTVTTLLCCARTYMAKYSSLKWPKKNHQKPTNASTKPNHT
eukprot:21068-Heterococcus_DN1.PRE.1